MSGAEKQEMMEDAVSGLEKMEIVSGESSEQPVQEPVQEPVQSTSNDIKSEEKKPAADKNRSNGDVKQGQAAASSASASSCLLDSHAFFQLASKNKVHSVVTTSFKRQLEHFRAYHDAVFTLIDPNKKDVQAIIILPNKEIAQILFSVCQRTAEQLKLRIIISLAEKKNKKSQIVLGTIRELQEYVNTVRLNNWKLLVLDAVYESIPDIEKGIEPILSKAKNQLEVFVFSSTFALNVEDFMELPWICPSKSTTIHFKCKERMDMMEQTYQKELNLQKEKNQTIQKELKLHWDKNKTIQKELKLQKEKTETIQKELHLQKEKTDELVNTVKKLYSSLDECVTINQKLKSFTLVE